MDRELIWCTLNEIEVVLKGHFVGASGKHLDTYINKDGAYTHPLILHDLCREMAMPFRGEFEVTVGPEKGGILLSQGVGFWGETWNDQENSGYTVRSVYAEKEGDGFAFHRGYDKLLVGKKVLIVEDVLTTGGSVKKVIDAVAKLGGFVVGVSVICNRGGVKDSDLGSGAPALPPRLRSLLEIDLSSWEEADCPLCKQGVPINTDVGKGREFIARKKA